MSEGDGILPNAFLDVYRRTAMTKLLIILLAVNFTALVIVFLLYRKAKKANHPFTSELM